MPTAKRRRRLGDLYVRGKEVSVDDGEGDSVTVWIQKLNELDRDTLIRRANAAKARYRLEADREEGELYLATLTSIRDFVDREGMIAIIIAEDSAKTRQRIEAQMTHDKEGWGKDNKIQDLIDAWTGDGDSKGLAAMYAEDENDPEAVRVKGELEAFETDLDNVVREELLQLEKEWADASEADVIRAAAKEVLKRRADEEFMREWQRQQIFYCIREPDDHQARYFGTLPEVDDLHDKVREVLNKECNALFVDPGEGKDSPATPAPSISSEPPVTADPSTPSGPVAVTA